MLAVKKKNKNDLFFFFFLLQKCFHKTKGKSYFWDNKTNALKKKMAFKLEKSSI